MGESSKSCPNCNGTLSYRLGEFTCDSCDYVEVKQVEQTETRRASGPGFQSGQQYSSPPVHSQQAPPPPGSLYTPGQTMGGGAESGGKPIEWYENLFVGCITFFIPLVGVIVAYSWSKQNRQGAESCLTASWVWFGISVILGIISLVAGPRG